MVNNVSGSQNKAEGQKLHIVTSLKYTGAISQMGVLSRIAQASSALKKPESSIEKITTYLSKQN